jgi:hypothetical protein
MQFICIILLLSDLDMTNMNNNKIVKNKPYNKIININNNSFNLNNTFYISCINFDTCVSTPKK